MKRFGSNPISTESPQSSCFSSLKLLLQSSVHLNQTPCFVRSLRGLVTSLYVLPASGLMKLAQNCTVCKKLFTSALSLGSGHSLMMLTLAGSGLMPCLVKTFPNHRTSVFPNLHFSFLRVSPYSMSLCITFSSLLSCSLPSPWMTRSSLICTTPSRLISTSASLAWHSADAGGVPMANRLNLKSPNGVVNLKRSLLLSSKSN